MIPKGYNHKATSEGFNGINKTQIFYSKYADDYLVVINDEPVLFLDKPKLELLVHAATDVLEMAKHGG